MQILMDIDGTIARQDDAQLIQLLWQALGLPPDTCPQMVSLTEVLALPQVNMARSRMGDKRFRMLISMLQQSESAIASRLIIPGAHEALHRLAHLGQLCYCTARKAIYSGKNVTSTQTVDALNARMQRATSGWLTQHGFPCPDRVIFCRGARGKLETIASCIHESEDVLFVENELDAVIAAFADLSQEMQAQIAAHTTMLAFGQDSCPLMRQITTLRCLAFPTWDQLDDVLRALVDAGKDSPRWILQKQPTASQKT